MHIVNALLRCVLAHAQLTSIPRGQDRGVRGRRLAHPHPRLGVLLLRLRCVLYLMVFPLAIWSF